MTKKEWAAKGEKLFGKDQMKWKFVCPSCGHIASVQDYKDAGAGSGAVAFSCIGRYLKKPNEAFQQGKSPCNYAGGGLIRINPLEVDGEGYFDFATPEATPAGGAGNGRP